MVDVEDVDAHHARAAAAGAQVVLGPETYGFGERQYTVLDLAGHLWTFTESVADVDPAGWAAVAQG